MFRAESHDLESCSRRLPSYHVGIEHPDSKQSFKFTAPTTARIFPHENQGAALTDGRQSRNAALPRNLLQCARRNKMKRFIARGTLITVVGVTIVLAAWLVDSRANSQQPDRIVVRKPWPVEPVRVVAVKTKNKANVEIGKAFVEDDDWLDGFTVKVVNNYHKTVTVMTISMVFRRDAGDIRPPFAWNLHFGPGAMTAEYKDRDPNKVVKAGETFELGVSPEDYKLIKAAFEETGYPTKIKRVELVVREVGFEDGSVLYSGTVWSQDPDHPDDPTKKVRVPESPGAQNQKMKYPQSLKDSVTGFAFLKASFISPNLTLRPDPDCRAQEPPRVRNCAPTISVKSCFLRSEIQSRRRAKKETAFSLFAEFDKPENGGTEKFGNVRPPRCRTSREGWLAPAATSAIGWSVSWRSLRRL